MSTNLYDLLGIETSASPEEGGRRFWRYTGILAERFSVRRAYKLKALETHPDKLDPGASSEEKQVAETRFHQVRAVCSNLTVPTSLNFSERFMKLLRF